MPKVTVITVCRNAEQVVSKTIKSVLNQEFKHFEYLIVDGDSLDKTVQVINEFSDARIKLITEPDQGIYDAMNKGIKHANGDYVIFLNAGDEYATNNALGNLYDAAIANDCQIVYSGIRYKSIDGALLNEWVPKQMNCDRSLYAYGFHVPHPGFFACRDLFIRFGSFDIEFPIAADFDLMMRFMTMPEVKSVLLPQVTVNMDNSGVSSTFLGILSGMMQIKRSFKKQGVKVNMPRYILLRYLPKVRAKIKNVLS